MSIFGFKFSLLDIQFNSSYFHFLVLKFGDRSLLGWAQEGRAKTFQILYVVNLNWI